MDRFHICIMFINESCFFLTRRKMCSDGLNRHGSYSDELLLLLWVQGEDDKQTSRSGRRTVKKKPCLIKIERRRGFSQMGAQHYTAVHPGKWQIFCEWSIDSLLSLLQLNSPPGFLRLLIPVPVISSHTHTHTPTNIHNSRKLIRIPVYGAFHLQLIIYYRFFPGSDLHR